MSSVLSVESVEKVKYELKAAGVENALVDQNELHRQTCLLMDLAEKVLSAPPIPPLRRRAARSKDEQQVQTGPGTGEAKQSALAPDGGGQRTYESDARPTKPSTRSDRKAKQHKQRPSGDRVNRARKSDGMMEDAMGEAMENRPAPVTQAVGPRRKKKVPLHKQDDDESQRYCSPNAYRMPQGIVEQMTSQQQPQYLQPDQHFQSFSNIASTNTDTSLPKDLTRVAAIQKSEQTKQEPDRRDEFSKEETGRLAGVEPKKRRKSRSQKPKSPGPQPPAHEGRKVRAKKSTMRKGRGGSRGTSPVDSNEGLVTCDEPYRAPDAVMDPSTQPGYQTGVGVNQAGQSVDADMDDVSPDKMTIGRPNKHKPKPATPQSSQMKAPQSKTSSSTIASAASTYSNLVTAGPSSDSYGSLVSAGPYMDDVPADELTSGKPNKQHFDSSDRSDQSAVLAHPPSSCALSILQHQDAVAKAKEFLASPSGLKTEDQVEPGAIGQSPSSAESVRKFRNFLPSPANASLREASPAKTSFRENAENPPDKSARNARNFLPSPSNPSPRQPSPANPSFRENPENPPDKSVRNVRNFLPSPAPSPRQPSPANPSLRESPSNPPDKSVRNVRNFLPSPAPSPRQPSPANPSLRENVEASLREMSPAKLSQREHQPVVAVSSGPISRQESPEITADRLTIGKPSIHRAKPTPVPKEPAKAKPTPMQEPPKVVPPIDDKSSWDAADIQTTGKANKKRLITAKDVPLRSPKKSGTKPKRKPTKETATKLATHADRKKKQKSKKKKTDSKKKKDSEESKVGSKSKDKEGKGKEESPTKVETIKAHEANSTDVAASVLGPRESMKMDPTSSILSDPTSSLEQPEPTNGARVWKWELQPNTAIEDGSPKPTRPSTLEPPPLLTPRPSMPEPVTSSDKTPLQQSPQTSVTPSKSIGDHAGATHKWGKRTKVTLRQQPGMIHVKTKDYTATGQRTLKRGKSKHPATTTSTKEPTSGESMVTAKAQPSVPTASAAQSEQPTTLPLPFMSPTAKPEPETKDPGDDSLRFDVNAFIAIQKRCHGLPQLDRTPDILAEDENWPQRPISPPPETRPPKSPSKSSPRSVPIPAPPVARPVNRCKYTGLPVLDKTPISSEREATVEEKRQTSGKSPPSASWNHNPCNACPTPADPGKMMQFVGPKHNQGPKDTSDERGKGEDIHGTTFSCKLLPDLNTRVSTGSASVAAPGSKEQETQVVSAAADFDDLMTPRKLTKQKPLSALFAKMDRIKESIKWKGVAGSAASSRPASDPAQVTQSGEGYQVPAATKP